MIVAANQVVVCLICGKALRSLNGHLKKHGLTADEYHVMFPEAPTRSVVTQGLCSRAMLRAHRRNPERWNWTPERRLVMNTYYQDPEWLENQSRKGIEFFEKHPEMRTALSEFWTKWNKENYVRMCANLAKARTYCRHRPSSLERAISSLLEKNGIQFEREHQLSFLKGRLQFHRFDFAVPESKLVIEADGCFYHGCDCVRGSRDCDFVRLQMVLDRIQTCAVRDVGWKILRFWGHAINSQPEWVEEQILEAVGTVKEL